MLQTYTADARSRYPTTVVRAVGTRGAIRSVAASSSRPQGSDSRFGPSATFGLTQRPVSRSAFQRLVDLLGNEQDIPILAPTLQREIVYRLLVGDQGMRMRQIAAVGSQSHEVARAIEWLKGNFDRPLRVEDLAASAGMSGSTFYHHFRSMTALSPLQYQKRLRLQEARRLMLAEHLDSATAGYRVGYESPSQFSREYSRLFGAPPARDISSLRPPVHGAASPNACQAPAAPCRGTAR